MIENGLRYFDMNCGNNTPIDYLSEITKIEKPNQICLVIFSSGEGNIRKFIDIVAGAKNIIVFCSGYIQRMQKPTFNLLHQIKGITVRNVDTHMKMILCKTKNNYYVINSTSNLNSNSKIELTEISNCKNEYEFYYNFFMSKSKPL